ncbi:DUF3060 domain-containing protein [Mycobacterium sp. CBMA293]|uniref:DUF3060 domain-containing protein n=1 Tax=unclassified Mycolicibacterium TaxID=2636767 RepID=UPI0012DD795E|nr:MULTISPECIES: DUF3060 domain-containing protein [unclassified Mycolicibacterium]MUL49537.1 DUF3060 domain-containing protein [Mycolicibacterium sp. CBMA 360]MUL62121.1 DUF3060 domain-containing protein [Mycolicibacterium sp. CBMA 335]MUL63945.1 hypothetical protein [Mycolicibacterium sp. CBMA 234]MUL73396.1 DUF3060 domain-containing protein [Mycolicibacterium sp. CBMA 311]MUL96565.1 DUF3060 domain-containing protein [Mycolicibacterium sp. CBMA 230]
MNPKRIAVAAGTVAAAALVLTGCGSQDSKSGGSSSAAAATTAVSGAPTTAQVEVGNTINYSAVGTTRDLDCANGKSLTVGGANNTLTVKGTCSKANIGGTDNKVTFEKVDQELDVVGMHATVTYKDGSPKVTNTGTGNAVSKG